MSSVEFLLEDLDGIVHEHPMITKTFLRQIDRADPIKSK